LLRSHPQSGFVFTDFAAKINHQFINGIDLFIVKKHPHTRINGRDIHVPDHKPAIISLP